MCSQKPLPAARLQQAHISRRPRLNRMASEAASAETPDCIVVSSNSIARELLDHSFASSPAESFEDTYIWESSATAEQLWESWFISDVVSSTLPESEIGVACSPLPLLYKDETCVDAPSEERKLPGSYTLRGSTRTISSRHTAAPGKDSPITTTTLSSVHKQHNSWPGSATPDQTPAEHPRRPRSNTTLAPPKYLQYRTMLSSNLKHCSSSTDSLPCILSPKLSSSSLAYMSDRSIGMTASVRAIEVSSDCEKSVFESDDEGQLEEGRNAMATLKRRLRLRHEQKEQDRSKQPPKEGTARLQKKRRDLFKTILGVEHSLATTGML